jgi:hypothetical protein
MKNKIKKKTGSKTTATYELLVSDLYASLENFREIIIYLKKKNPRIFCFPGSRAKEYLKKKKSAKFFLLRFKGEGNLSHPGGVPGDIVFVVVADGHANFERIGDSDDVLYIHK